MPKRRNYDDKFRASAVLMLEAAGYPDTKGALTHVAEHLNVPARTLSRWFNGEQNPPPDQSVNEKKIDFLEAIRHELGQIFGAMSLVRDEASYRDLATAAAILIDKMQLLEGKPTNRDEIIEHGLSDETRANRVIALLDAARTRRDGQLATGLDD